MITRDEYLMGRDKTFADEFTDELSANADELLEAVNEFFAEYTGPLIVNSGWRPEAVNAATPGAAAHSKHMECLAVDINDPDQKIMQYILANLDKAADLNLYMEDWRWTAVLRGGKIVGRWSHLQLGGPKSRKRIFVPSAALPFDPHAWGGRYDSKWDK